MPVDRATTLVAPVAADNERRRSFFRSFIQFLFSNLGLVIVVFAYSVGGAFLFILLEQYIELQNCQQGNLKENISITNISETIHSYVIINKDKIEQQQIPISIVYEDISKHLKNFTQEIYGRRSTLRYRGQNCTTASDWSFPSALLFTITVITTIGYGHVTPTSWEGQITCICYALIGIPIFLLCLANISSVLGDIFRFMYSGLLHCCCCVCRIYTRHHRRITRQNRLANLQKGSGIDYIGSANADPCWPEASRHSAGKLTDYDESKSYINDDDDDDDIDDDIWNRMESRVPFGAVILIIIGYICLGAFMFNKFEGWTMTEAVYFSYVTLATIGFGDYVPGITSGSTSGLRFLLASIYILFGLAILAMCFDLIKEGIVDKFRWFANKLGIVAGDDDPVDEDRTRYANFEYAKSNSENRTNSLPAEKSIKQLAFQTKTISNAVAGYESTDGTWVKNIRDKSEAESPTSMNQKEVQINDEKHLIR